MTKRDFPFWFFVLVLLGILYLFFTMIRPFILTFVWATILVSTFNPVYKKVLQLTHGREGLSSWIMIVGITVIIIIPVLIVILIIARESLEAYTLISSKMNTLKFNSLDALLKHPYISKIIGSINSYIDLRSINIKGAIVSILKYVSTFLVSQSKALFSSAAKMLFNFFLLLISTFYFFKDGDKVLKEIRKLSPLEASREEKIIARFNDVTQATMLGIFSTATLQGVLGGIGFLIVGLPSPVLWGAVMAFMALVPIVGTFVIWIPASIYLILTHHLGKALFLIIWGAIIVGLSDNLLKPIIIKGKARLHPIVIFFSLLAGLSLFGFSGLILGPLVTALTFVFLDIYREEFKEQLPGTTKLTREQIQEALNRSTGKATNKD